MRPPEKRVWNLSQDFLVLLSQHVQKTGKPIRTQDSTQSCDFNAYWNTARFQFQLPSVIYTRIGIGPYAQKAGSELRNIRHRADSAMPRNPAKDSRPSFRAGAREGLGTRLSPGIRGIYLFYIERI